jgi:hypothetical protein
MEFHALAPSRAETHAALTRVFRIRLDERADALTRDFFYPSEYVASLQPQSKGAAPASATHVKSSSPRDIEAEAEATIKRYNDMIKKERSDAAKAAASADNGASAAAAAADAGAQGSTVPSPLLSFSCMDAILIERSKHPRALECLADAWMRAKHPSGDGSAFDIAPDSYVHSHKTESTASPLLKRCASLALNHALLMISNGDLFLAACVSVCSPG